MRQSVLCDIIGRFLNLSASSAQINCPFIKPLSTTVNRVDDFFTNESLKLQHFTPFYRSILNLMDESATDEDSSVPRSVGHELEARG